MCGETASDSGDLRDRAIKRIKEKNDFKVHLTVYVAVNTMLVLIWAATGDLVTVAPGLPAHFFWPVFPMAGWGVGILMHAYTVYRGQTYSESQVRREMDRLAR